MQGVILAGGEGRRLMPLTKSIPKPMVEIEGKPLLQYQIELFKKNNIENIVLCLHYLSSNITDYFRKGEKFGVNLSYSIEKEPLGTAGAVKNAESLINDDFIVMYGDNLANFDLTKLINFHKEKMGIASIALHKKTLEELGTSIVEMNKKNKICRFIEKPKSDVKTKGKLANAGIYVMERRIFNKIPCKKCDFGYDIFPRLIGENEELYGYAIKGFFLEVGEHRKLELAKKEVKNGNFYRHGKS